MKPNLRAVDNQIEHPHDMARREVKRWRSNAEKDRLPLSNQHTHEVLQKLDVDTVLEKSFKQIG